MSRVTIKSLKEEIAALQKAADAAEQDRNNLNTEIDKWSAAYKERYDVVTKLQQDLRTARTIAGALGPIGFQEFKNAVGSVKESGTPITGTETVAEVLWGLVRPWKRQTAEVDVLMREAERRGDVISELEDRALSAEYRAERAERALLNFALRHFEEDEG